MRIIPLGSGLRQKVLDVPIKPLGGRSYTSGAISFERWCFLYIIPKKFNDNTNLQNKQKDAQQGLDCSHERLF